MLYRVLILLCWFTLGGYWRMSAASAKPASQVQSPESRLARFPVWLGFILVAVAGSFPEWGSLPYLKSRAAAQLGVTVCVLGLAFAIWARRTLGDDWSRDVELKEDHRLVVRGPYHVVRHPIYTAHLLMAMGSAVSFGNLAGFAAVISFFIGFQVKLRQEEELLARNFPQEYPEYRNHTKALFPWLL